MHVIRWKNWIKNIRNWGEKKIWEKRKNVKWGWSSFQFKNCLDEDTQQKNVQQKNVLENYFSNKADGTEVINNILDAIYALLATIKLRKIWKQHHQYLKCMGFLPNKRKNKYDVFLCHICLPSRGSNGQDKDLKEELYRRQPTGWCHLFFFRFVFYDFLFCELYCCFI